MTPILFALAPARRTARAHVETRRPRFFLIAGEVAIALTLLILAGLTVRTTAALSNLELGFDANDLLTMRIDLPDSRYSDRVAPRAFFDGLVRQARAVPGAESAALTSHRPIVGSEPNQSLVLEGRLGVLGAAPDDVAWAATTTVSTEFFRTLRIRLLSGRVFTDAETRPTAVISRSAHERYWAGEDPIGTRFRFGDDGDSWWAVVGIVEDLRNPEADQPPEPHVYLPFEQQPSKGMALVVRSRTPLALTPELRVIVSKLDAAQPIGDIRTMGQILHDDLSGTFAVAGLMSYFTFVAFALAIAGIFGVLSYSVAERSRELGVRLELGAERIDICWMVLRQAFAPVGAGIAVGCLVALGLSRFMASFVFGITTTDPATYLFVTLWLAVSATVACGVPALRAARIDPIVTLRHD